MSAPSFPNGLTFRQGTLTGHMPRPGPQIPNGRWEPHEKNEFGVYRDVRHVVMDGAAQAQQFIDNGDGTISDLKTRLTWERKPQIAACTT